MTWNPAPRCLADVEAVAEALLRDDDWLIVTHERPDGDAIGSALAVSLLLEKIGKRWTFMVETPLPARFDYLEHYSKATVVSDEYAGRFQHVVAVDCADAARYAALQFVVAEGATVVNVDHHRTNPRFGVANAVDADAAATCEILFHLAKALQVPLSEPLSAALYTGILTDTAGFVQPNTTPEVYQIAAELLMSGVRPYDIAEPALEARSAEQMHLLQMALSNLTVSEDGRYAALYVTRGMIEGAGAEEDDVEGLVGFARSIDTVEVGILFRETPLQQVKVSLRSKRRVDVSEVAQRFGGGGHIRAAGCTLETTLEDAMEKIFTAVERALDEARV